MGKANNLAEIKKLRSETTASIADVTKALNETGSMEEARKWLKKKGAEIADKKKERETRQGLIEAYTHQNGKVGSLVVLLCETDFVARTDEFKNLAHEISMQVAAMNPKDVETLLKQEYIRDSSMTVAELIKQAVAKLGENIVVKEISRYEL